jgi:hypothetical protein
MTVIELPDDAAAALTAKAAADGLSLEAWLKRLAKGEETPPAGEPIQPIWEVIIDSMKNVPAEDLAALPHDGASQIDHYVYGVPKREL